MVVFSFVSVQFERDQEGDRLLSSCELVEAPPHPSPPDPAERLRGPGPRAFASHLHAVVPAAAQRPGARGEPWPPRPGPCWTREERGCAGDP